jgi:putative CocE/NonD family hydrolase
VESRGAFQAYQELRGDGAHLMVIGAHDGAPAGTDGGTGEAAAWFDHYVRGVSNGVEMHPRVQLWLADGDREDDLAGDYVRYDGSDWPIPGTRWAPLALDATRSGTAHSINDGTLTRGPARKAGTPTYPSLPSFPLNTDPPNTAIVGSFGINALATAIPLVTEMTLAEPLGLSFTTAPLQQDVLTAGPMDLDLRLSSTAPETGIWAVVSDVWPDGTPHPVASGRLLSSFPGVDDAKSLHDPVSGDLVQPYGIYDHKTTGALGQVRTYHVELWPIGNRFRAGHRLRLHVIGASAASLPTLPALNTLRVGGDSGSRLMVPVLPGSDIAAALP